MNNTEYSILIIFIITYISSHFLHFMLFLLVIKDDHFEPYVVWLYRFSNKNLVIYRINLTIVLLLYVTVLHIIVSCTLVLIGLLKILCIPAGNISNLYKGPVSKQIHIEDV